MANMELITSVTVGSGGASSVTLPATGTIPQTYTDLKIVLSTRTTTGGNTNAYINFNGTTSTYTGRRLYAVGSSAYSDTEAGWANFNNGATTTSSTFSNNEIYFPNYSVAGVAKCWSVDSVVESNSTSGNIMALGAESSAFTSAITSITITPDNNYVEGSTFYLYGISAVPSSPKATGGIVSQDATYWYHTFPFSSTFIPTQALSADILCIAGGGSGGASSGAGGGAGGLRGLTAQSLTSATSYTCTIGAGGAGVGATSVGNNGSNSSFAGSGLTTISTTGGGRGSANGGTPSTGGSGGGGSDVGSQAGAAGNAGSYSPVEGYAGGAGSTSGGGGGGGAGAVGNVGSGTNPGKGGDGVNTYSSWANATFTGVNGYYAGGGSGYVSASSAPGGAGGGGNSGTSATQTDKNGVPNTGSGGAAWNGAGTSGQGGSGLVIVRYAK